MYSATYHINKLFSYLALTNEEEEESLIDESQREGTRFSEQFRAKYGAECTQFMESSLNDAVFVFDVSHLVRCCNVVKIAHYYLSFFLSSRKHRTF